MLLVHSYSKCHSVLATSTYNIHTLLHCSSRYVVILLQCACAVVLLDYYCLSHYMLSYVIMQCLTYSNMCSLAPEENSENSPWIPLSSPPSHHGQV